MAAALWWLVLETIAGSLSFATLVLDAQALQRMFMALTALVGSLSQLVEHQLWLRRLAEFFALRQAISAPEHAEPAPRRILQGIAVRGVRFRHNGATRDALQDVSCTFKPGEITGIAGVNGAGKSTLIRLLARLSDPDAGAVLVDGVDLRAMAPEAWRQRIGVIFQDFGRYELAVHETVALATGGNAARVDVERALAAATATPVVERIPGGSDGIPGPRFGGGELSLGEWQRLALARALLPDAAVLLLDEPTAALDGAAEEALFAELRRRAPGRVILVVAHRPSALALCNRVIRLHDGRIVADGGPGAQRA